MTLITDLDDPKVILPIFSNSIQATINENDWTPNSDWAFSYDSSAGARSEQASQDGGVEGSYTTIGADGQLMEVRYRSGPEIGFVILNNDEVSKCIM